MARVDQGVCLCLPGSSPRGAQPGERPAVQSVAPSCVLGPPGVEAGPRGAQLVQAQGGGWAGWPDCCSDALGWLRPPHISGAKSGP